MKRKTRRTNPSLNITADRAAHVLHILIAEGKLTGKHVSDALKRREQLIHELRQRLDALEGGMASAVGRKPKRRMTATRRAALKLHGRYLGHIRTLPSSAKAKAKAIRKKAGVHAAIRAARIATNSQSPQQRKLTRYQERERPKPDKHGGSGSGRQQGGSGAGRERG